MKQKISSAVLAAFMLSSCGTATVNPVTGQTERSVMSEEAEIADSAGPLTLAIDMSGDPAETPAEEPAVASAPAV